MTEYQNISNGRQTWRLRDEGHGRAVVMFHGFPDRPETFDGVASRFRDAGYRTVLPYLRGYHPDTIVAGRPYDAAHLTSDGLDLLDELGLDTAIIIGHDWGAGVAYGMAATAPERVEALVAISGPHPTALEPDLRAAWALRHFIHFKLPFAEARTRRNDFAYMERLIRRIRPGDTPAEIAALLAPIRDLMADPVVLTGVIDYYRDFSPRIDDSYKTKLPMPYLLVAGALEVDLLGGDEMHQRSCDAFDPAGQLLIVPGGMHSPHVDDEDLFVKTTLEFLDRVRPTC